MHHPAITLAAPPRDAACPARPAHRTRDKDDAITPDSPTTRRGRITRWRPVEVVSTVQQGNHRLNLKILGPVEITPNQPTENTFPNVASPGTPGTPRAVVGRAGREGGDGVVAAVYEGSAREGRGVRPSGARNGGTGQVPVWQMGVGQAGDLLCAAVVAAPPDAFEINRN